MLLCKKNFLLLLLLFIGSIGIAQVTEDFESSTAAGWTTSGTASSGTFIVANPTQQSTSGVITQPEDDNTAAPGVNAYFTATNSSAGNQDVDGGTSITTSPVYNIVSLSQLSIYYFFGQRDNGDDSNDFFLLEYSLNSGGSYTTLANIGDVRTNATWNQATATIPAGSNVVIRVTVSDGSGPGDIIEGGIDDLTIIPLTPAISMTDVSVNENVGTATFTATHAGINASGAFTVNYQTVDGSATAGSDYTGIGSGTLSFNGTVGDTETITVTITNDSFYESSEMYSIQFTSVSDTSVDISDTATGTIVDDEVILNEVPLTLYNEFNGYYDYAVTGGSMRDQNNPTYCSIKPTSTVNGLTSNIPSTGTVVQAYLLWSHSNQTPDTQVTFEGQTVNAELVYGASMSGGRLFYGMMSDVTSIITGLANPSTNVYDFTNLNIDNTDSVASYCSTGTVLGGWSLLVFYEEDTLPAVSINMYHGFKGESNTSRSYTLDGFYAIGSTNAKTTVLSWEGDTTLNGSSGGTTNPNGEALTVTNQAGTTTVLSGDGGQTGNNAYNSTIYNNTPSGTINYNNSWGVDLDTFDISPYISAADSQITVNVHTGQDFVIANMVMVKVPSNLIVGSVFEDINYGGGVGRDMATSSGAGVESARVELFDGTGTLEEFTTSDAVGEYSFGGMANGNYSVRVVNGSISSTRGGGGSCGSCYPVQTYRRNFTTGSGFTNITNEVGGADPSSEDVGNNTLTNAQSVSSVSIASEGVIGLDFGFNFNTIVNTNEDGQGSLEQFIVNSNELDETGLDIEANAIFDPTAGDDTSIFMIPPTGDALGRTADGNFSSGYFDISISNGAQLIIITGTNTIIDGRTQMAYSGDTNTGTIGSGGSSVGISATALPNYNLPEVQVRGDTWEVFRNEGNSNTIRNLAIYLDDKSAIQINDGSLNVFENLIGVNALGVNTGNMEYGLEITDGEALIASNYFSGSGEAALLIDGGTSTIIEYNHIFQNGSGDTCTDNILINDGSDIVIRYNLINEAAGVGIEGDDYNSGLVITENTITNNGLNANSCGAQFEDSGIRLKAAGAIISSNIIHSNQGEGVVVAENVSDILISQNSFYNNGQRAPSLGIDLDKSKKMGDGVTLNDNGDGDIGPNGLLNFPIISAAYILGSDLVVKGWARPGATIEVFLTDINEGTATTGDNELGLSTDYGEGQTYLGTVIEGSVSDLDAGSSAYTDADGNTDNTNLYEFRIPLSSSVTIGEMITATATIANSTSEFSPMSILKVQTVITNRRITYRVNRN